MTDGGYTTRSAHKLVNGISGLVKRIVPARLIPLLLTAYGRLNALLYRGNALTCPCCGGRFRRFKAYGAVKRPNSMCPRCRSFERHRLIWLFLEQKTGFFTDELKVLHFAPEFWFRRIFGRLPRMTYVTVDLRSPLADLKADITDVPCDSEEFDVILCVHVLEHVQDETRAVSEVLRILKPGGWAIISVPVDAGRETTYEVETSSGAERLKAYGKTDHVRVYGRDFQERLESAGFIVTREDYAAELGPDAVRKYALNPSSSIYLCTKPVFF
ncbi:MAG TPA: methyltransferase domain-containing protein [Candidatus Anoxymicrobiaceae bacterium]